MKTYIAYFIVLAMLIFGCSKSEDESNNPGNTVSVDVDYSLVLSKESMLGGSLINANLESISINPDSGGFPDTALPQLSYKDGNEISFYRTLSSCNGTLSKYSFNTDSTTNTTIFEDIDACNLYITAIAHSQNKFFVAYEIPSTSKANYFFIRIVDGTNSDFNSNYTDISLDKKPLQLVFSGNKLFTLLWDEDETENFALSILDATTNTLIYEKNLGLHVQRIVKNSNEDILVSYPKSHSVINKNTFAIISEVRYLEGKEPNIGASSNNYFDGNRLFYQMQTELSPNYSNIPAVYDFSTNTAILYLYENLLSLEKREFEFKIEDTTLVAYDSKNDLILVGYKKKNNSNLGGLLRIKPAPNQKFIDNTDLPGVPYTIFFK